MLITPMNFALPTYGSRSLCVRVATVLASILLTAGCGQAAGNGQIGAGADQTVGDSVPEIMTTVQNDGERMVFPMKTFSGMTEVAEDSFPDPSKLPFPAFFPKSAGAPMGVFVSIPSQYPVGDAEVVAEYDASSPYNAFRIREELRPKGSIASSYIDGLPQVCASCTDARTFSLQPSMEAALLAGPNGPTSVSWIQGAFLMTVIGPADTFSPDSAIKVATEVSAGFDPTPTTG
jgi:hypothetical protein